MTNEIIVAITKALDAQFGHPVYEDEVEQKLKIPCFMIQIITGSQNHKLGTRYEQADSFDVLYFPKSKEKTSECLTVRQELYNILEYVEEDNKRYRATEMKGEVTDGVLHLFVDYKFMLRKTTGADDNMDTASVTVTKKEGE